MLYTVPCTLRNLKKDREDVGFRFDGEGNWRADQRPALTTRRNLPSSSNGADRLSAKGQRPRCGRSKASSASGHASDPHEQSARPACFRTTAGPPPRGARAAYSFSQRSRGRNLGLASSRILS